MIKCEKNRATLSGDRKEIMTDLVNLMHVCLHNNILCEEDMNASILLATAFEKGVKKNDPKLLEQLDSIYKKGMLS